MWRGVQREGDPDKLWGGGILKWERQPDEIQVMETDDGVEWELNGCPQ